MFPIAAGAQALTGLIQGIYGITQFHKGQQLAKQNPFPNEAIPEAILRNQKLSELYANTGLPGAQYEQGRQNIARQENQIISASNDRRGGLAVLPQVQQNANDATLNLDVANANARRQAQQQQIQQNNVLGTWQDKVWGWNKQQKFIQQAAAARALMGAGTQNEFGGADRVIGGGTTFAGNGGFNGGGGYGNSNGYQQGGYNQDPYGYDMQGTNNDNSFNSTG